MRDERRPTERHRLRRRPQRLPRARVADGGVRHARSSDARPTGRASTGTRTPSTRGNGPAIWLMVRKAPRDEGDRRRRELMVTGSGSASGLSNPMTMNLILFPTQSSPSFSRCRGTPPSGSTGRADAGPTTPGTPSGAARAVAMATRRTGAESERWGRVIVQRLPLGGPALSAHHPR